MVDVLSNTNTLISSISESSSMFYPKMEKENNSIKKVEIKNIIFGTYQDSLIQIKESECFIDLEEVDKESSDCFK